MRRVRLFIRAEDRGSQRVSSLLLLWVCAEALFLSSPVHGCSPDEKAECKFVWCCFILFLVFFRQVDSKVAPLGAVEEEEEGDVCVYR